MLHARRIHLHANVTHIITQIKPGYSKETYGAAYRVRRGRLSIRITFKVSSENGFGYVLGPHKAIYVDSYHMPQWRSPA